MFMWSSGFRAFVLGDLLPYSHPVLRIPMATTGPL